MNRKFSRADKGEFPRMEVIAYNLEDKTGLNQFLHHDKKMIKVPFSEETIPYYEEKKTGIAISHLGTSEAVAIGAYHFAANKVDL